MPNAYAMEASIAQLTAMGFSRTAASDALRQTNYDANAAAERLLS